MILATILTAATMLSCTTDMLDPAGVKNDSLKTLTEKPLSETFDISPYVSTRPSTSFMTR